MTYKEDLRENAQEIQGLMGAGLVLLRKSGEFETREGVTAAIAAHMAPATVVYHPVLLVSGKWTIGVFGPQRHGAGR